MAKDPAFLFYHEDFFSGVSDMTNDEVGAYIKCMCVQASKGGITEKHMKLICNSQDVHNVVKNKFVLNTETGLLENLRLRLETEKRKKYSESRSNNRKNKNNTSTKPNDISLTYEKHMENEDVNENEDVKEIKNGIEVGIKAKKPKIDFEEIVNIYNSVCVDIPRVTKIIESRKKAITKILENNTIEELCQVFKNVSESDYLNGKIVSWRADFDWILKPDNFVKILENNYKNKKDGKQFNNTGTDSNTGYKLATVDRQAIIQRATDNAANGNIPGVYIENIS